MVQLQEWYKSDLGIMQKIKVVQWKSKWQKSDIKKSDLKM